MIALQVGTDLLSRDLSYQGAQTPGLRTYRAPLLVAPRVHGEIYPVRTRALSISVEGDFATAVGTRSRKGSEPETSYATSSTRLDLGARFALRPVSGSRGGLSVLGGYRIANFEVGAAEDGSVLTGLPGIAYRAVRVGAGGDIPITESLSVIAEGAYLIVLSSGEITSDAYFPGSSAWGLDATAGFKYRLSPNFELRATGQLTRYAFSFRSAETDPFLATGAIDQYAGGALQLRFML